MGIEKPRKILRAYQRGFRAGYAYGEKGGIPPPPPTTEFAEATEKKAVDDTEKVNAPCPYCKRSIDHPGDCPNNTDGPEESPAFGVGDIVEGTGKLILGMIGQIISFPSQHTAVVKTSNVTVQVVVDEIKLLFPPSCILKKLKLPSGETIHCGDIFETPCGAYAMVNYINEGLIFPIAAVFWDTQDKVFRQSQYGTHEIKRVVWRMEESK